MNRRIPTPRRSGILAVAVGTLAALTFLVAIPRQSLAIETTDILRARPNGDLCKIVCGPCPNPMEIYQAFPFPPGEPSHPGGTEYSCHVFEEGCEGLGSCSLDREQLIDEADLYAAVEKGSLEGVQDALRTLGEHARVNVERSAIQVMGCNSQILAHLPVNAAMLEALQ
jgi:hypothetical protein